MRHFSLRHFSLRHFSTAALLLALSIDGVSQKGSGGQQTGGGGPQPSQSQSPTSTASSSAYRVEEDMLAYQASDVIAAAIALEVQNQRLIIYDQPTFINLQFYEAYAAQVAALESAFEEIPNAAAGSNLFGFTGSATGAQAVASILTAMRSSTEIGSQQTASQIDAIVAQLSHHLASPSTIIVPKLLLISSSDLITNTPIATDHCSAIEKTIPDQLACLLTVRRAALNRGSNADFQNVDKLFQSFLGNLLGSSVSSSLLSSNAAPAAPGTSPPSSSPPPVGAPTNNTAPLTAVPLLSSVILGRRLKSELMTPACGTGAISTKLLVLEPTAAGGGYRVRHNFWVELFWTTPDPAFNGGAVLTYLLIDPCTSQVIKSNTLRYIYDYGKFENTKKLKHRANFVPTYEPQ